MHPFQLIEVVAIAYVLRSRRVVEALSLHIAVAHLRQIEAHHLVIARRVAVVVLLAIVEAHQVIAVARLRQVVAHIVVVAAILEALRADLHEVRTVVALHMVVARVREVVHLQVAAETREVDSDLMI